MLGLLIGSWKLACLEVYNLNNSENVRKHRFSKKHFYVNEWAAINNTEHILPEELEILRRGNKGYKPNLWENRDIKNSKDPGFA